MTAHVTMPVDGPFSLAAAAGFGFGPSTGRPFPDGDVMRLAFAADDLKHHVGAALRQNPDGSLAAEISGDADPAAAEAQIRRILSIDADPAGWLAAGQADPVLGQVQQAFPGLRPVLFHSPYEAAAWSVLSQRRHRSQATALPAAALGRRGRHVHYRGPAMRSRSRCRSSCWTSARFPGSRRPGWRACTGSRARRWTASSRPPTSRPRRPRRRWRGLRTIKGLGPVYAMLVYLRSTGVRDAAALGEPRLASYLQHYYGLASLPSTEEVARIAEPWRPFRTWASVLFRVAGDRDGLPSERAR